MAAINDLAVSTESTDVNRFSRIKKLLQIFFIIPVSTASGKKSFSNLRRVKTYLRSNMRGNLLNDIGMMNIHRGFRIVPENVVQIYLERWGKSGSRLTQKWYDLATAESDITLVPPPTSADLDLSNDSGDDPGSATCAAVTEDADISRNLFDDDDFLADE